MLTRERALESRIQGHLREAVGNKGEATRVAAAVLANTHILGYVGSVVSHLYLAPRHRVTHRIELLNRLVGALLCVIDEMRGR